MIIKHRELVRHAAALLAGSCVCIAFTSACVTVHQEATTKPSKATPSTTNSGPDGSAPTKGASLPAASGSQTVVSTAPEPSDSEMSNGAATHGPSELQPAAPPAPPAKPLPIVEAGTDPQGDASVQQGDVITFPNPLLASAPSANGHILFMKQNRHVYRIEAKAGAQAVDIDLLLDTVSEGTEASATISYDGEWFALTTQRFGCTNWECLVIAPLDLSRVEIVRTPAGQVHAPAIVGTGGNVIAYSEPTESHGGDIFVIHRNAARAWMTPVNVSATSPYSFNSFPVFNADGTKIAFDCGPEPYGDPRTAICEVNADGSGFHVALDAIQSNGQHPYYNRPSYGPDGSLYFETEYPLETVGHLPLGATAAVDVASEYTDDNSPCVLPNGQIVSLWMGRPGNGNAIVDSVHEMKVMSADGKSYFVLMPLEEIFDGGHYCGK